MLDSVPSSFKVTLAEVSDFVMVSVEEVNSDSEGQVTYFLKIFHS